jgi:UDP-N-acetylmuramyl pentapeptide phosphotransferase/UDP-N-acetylglucosamine-1-phosphate transferase
MVPFVNDESSFAHWRQFQLASYLSAILSLQTTVILGIGDDLFDIRWRHKLLIPAFAAIPMLVVYFVDFGVTHVVVPVPLRPYLGELFDLGMLESHGNHIIVFPNLPHPSPPPLHL